MSNLKKVVALALALALVLTMFAGATIKTKLPVVDAEKFTEAQQEAAALLMPLGVLSGVGADELGTGTVTRAQMVAFIYRLVNGGDAGKDAYYSKTALYSDVDPEYWGAPYINWAYAAKVAFGYGATFGPEDPVTGAQAAAMLVRLLGKDASGNDYALKAEANAIALQLDKGIETKGLYENALSRGDMFIFLANALMTEYKDGNEITTIAQKYFDLEIIEGAILLGVDAIGSNAYNVFAFRTDTAGNVKYFWTDLLCIEDLGDATTADYDCIGCKYTLLVSKSQNVQGYRQLYAAYEEAEGRYYKVVKGTVDDGVLTVNADGVLVYRANGKAVPLDKNVRYYVNGTEMTAEDFYKSFWFNGVYNPAIYKLIDNDGDGAYEYVVVQRLTLADLGTETITAKVTAVTAGGTITLTKADGTSVTVDVGSYWVVSGGFPSILVNNTNKIYTALGIDQAGYAPYTAISDIYYDFVVAGDYVYDIKVSEKTNFAGNYGILAAWSTPLTMYKNMPYACFVNEKSEYFWSYVKYINGFDAALTTFVAPNNSLIYFTDGDASDDVVSFYTAGYFNSNYTYRELLLADGGAKNAVKSTQTIKFTLTVWSKVDAKSKNYTDLVGSYSQIYAIFDFDPADPKGDGSVPAIQYWDAKNQTKVDVPAGTSFDTALDRKIDGFAVLDYKQLEGKYYVPVDANSFYGIAALDDCDGFIYVTNDSMEVTIKDNKGLEETADEFQIYRANGFWHLRFYTDIGSVTADDLDVYYKGYRVYKDGAGVWVIDFSDNTDPMAATSEEQLPVAEFVKGFDATQFETQIAAAKAALASAGGYIRSDYTLLNTSVGVVFAYGAIIDKTDDEKNPPAFNAATSGNGFPDATAYRWVAYDAKTFNANFGLGNPGNDILPIGTNTADELIYTKIGGTFYVKALKVSDTDATNLPYGWIAANNYDLVVFGGLTGNVNTEGWQIKLFTFSKEGIKESTVYTKLGTGFAQVADVMLVKLDEKGNLVEIYAVGVDVFDYLEDYLGNTVKTFGKGRGWLTAATTVKGDDKNGNYFETSLEGKSVYYIWVDGAGNFRYNTDFAKAPKNGNKIPMVRLFSCGGFVFVYYTGAWADNYKAPLGW